MTSVGSIVWQDFTGINLNGQGRDEARTTRTSPHPGDMMVHCRVLVRRVRSAAMTHDFILNELAHTHFARQNEKNLFDQEVMIQPVRLRFLDQIESLLSFTVNSALVR
jgi:hypothetical protein